jgi:PAS domain-containing protein
MHPNDIAYNLPGLRRRAQVLLEEGRVPEAGRYDASDALRVLCRLALDQGTAPEALALLHELQVHQVELDLQHEEMVRTQRALEEELRQQVILFDKAPVGCLLLDDAGVVRGFNHAAPGLLGLPPGSLEDVLLVGLLTEAGREQLHRLLVLATAGAPPRTRTLQFKPQSGMAGLLFATAERNATGDGFLVALMAPPVD